MSYDSALRHHVLRCLHKDMEFAQDAVEVGERSLCFSMFDIVVWVELTTAGAGRISTIAGTDVKPTLALLRELNAWNGRLSGAKVWIDDDRDVMVVADFRTESLEPGELGDLVSAVVDCAQRLGPMVEVMFGKASPPSTSEQIDR